MVRLLLPDALFADRPDAGRRLAAGLDGERGPKLVVVGLARGGVVIAAEVARALDAPLDAVAVRKVRHVRQPEYGIGAVTPGGGGLYVRDPDGLTEAEVNVAVRRATTEAALLERRLHAEHPPLDLSGKTVAVVDDGLATGVTMIAAVPVAAAGTLALVAGEAHAVVSLDAPKDFVAVGAWYRSFDQVDDETVIQLLDENRQARRLRGSPPGTDPAHDEGRRT
jgi:putative phosphoribosyl transferase